MFAEFYRVTQDLRNGDPQLVAAKVWNLYPGVGGCQNDNENRCVEEDGIESVSLLYSIE